MQILAVTVRVIQKDSDEKKSVFNARPYFRLFINWLLDIGSLDPVHDGVNLQVQNGDHFIFLHTYVHVHVLSFSGHLQVLTAFANAFHSLQPLRVPAFRFESLHLLSHLLFLHIYTCIQVQNVEFM